MRRLVSGACLLVAVVYVEAAVWVVEVVEGRYRAWVLS